MFDTERVKLSGLACEVVIPPEWIDGSDPTAAMNRQFARTPYAVSFQADLETFILLTAHIDYGAKAADRIPELGAIAKWMRDWAEETNSFGQSLLVLGDFNIDRKDDALWKAFTSTNLFVPEDLQNVPRSIFIDPGADPRLDKYYDQIAWFNSSAGKAKTDLIYRRGGSFDFVPFAYTETGISKTSLSHRISDHYPLWAEFQRRR
jgi:endonuclease/exonuclease/phosphatase family metal-dependent hydrolase